jgi:hypothetical protein
LNSVFSLLYEKAEQLPFIVKKLKKIDVTNKLILMGLRPVKEKTKLGLGHKRCAGPGALSRS